MIRILATTVRKLAALALVFAIPLALWLLLVQPLWQSYLDTQEKLAETAVRYARFKSMADQESAVRQAAAAAPGDRSKIELSGESAAIVQASLQSTLQTLVSESGVGFLSAQATPPKIEDGISYQGLQLVLSGELGAIADGLRRIEEHRPYFFVDRIELRRQGMATEDESYLPVLLDVTMDVYAAHASAPTESGQEN